jgi:hypothetical protein
LAGCEFFARIGGLEITRPAIEGTPMCTLRAPPAWDETIEVTMPFAGPIIAFIGMCIALFTVVS